jgi:hypothetical protein
LLATGDAVRLPFADQGVDLVLGSPIFTDRRRYLEDGRDMGIARKPKEWVRWMMQVSREAVRVSRGLVLWVATSPTKGRNYRAVAECLSALWWLKGGLQECPIYWRKVGIPGKQGRPAQWYRQDVELILAFKGEELVPWADPLANGHPNQYAPGGAMSHQLTGGTRRNQWGAGIKSNRSRGSDGKMRGRPRPSHEITTRAEIEAPGGHRPPKRANPGNCILDIPVGGGLMGHPLASEINEAPYPQRLAERLIRAHCPPGGIVLDPFSGSGTTVAAALRLGRCGIGIDIRDTQVRRSRVRIETPRPEKKPRHKSWASLSPDNEWRSRIAARVRAMGYSYGRLAAETGVDRAAIMRYVKGERDVNAATLEKLCDTLGLLLVPREQLAALQYEPLGPDGVDDDHIPAG